MSDKVFKINFPFFLVLILSIQTFCIDYLQYLTNFSYIINVIISIIFICIICTVLFLKKRIEIEKNFEKGDIFFFSFLIIICALTIVYPDKSFDTNNYHLYNQLNPFESKIYKDFFPSSFIQSYSYAFPDRMFYIFRYFLGYRLGTILNYFLIMVLYYQVKRILNNVFKINGYFKYIIATFSVLTISILDVADSYYIDIISVIFLIEIFQKALYGPLLSDKKINNTIFIAYLGLLSGIAFATKISNMFFILVLAIVYIIRNIKNFKKIRLIDYFLFFLFFLLPGFLYVSYTWKQTGNPFFPFYNTIFKSPFYPIENWMDTRFGIKKKWEGLIWPIVFYFKPEHAFDTGIIEPIWSYGYLIAIYYIIKNFMKKLKGYKYDNEILKYSIIFVILNVVWAYFCLGYVRYGLILLILNNILFGVALYNSFIKNKVIKITILSIMFFYNCNYCYNKYSNGDFWSFNNYYAYSKEAYFYNIKKLFKSDYVKIKFPKNSVWANIDSNSGYMKLIEPNMPIITLKYSELNDINVIRNNHLKNVDHIYTVVDYLEFNDFINYLNNTGYQIKKVKSVIRPNFLNYNNLIYILELAKTDESNYLINNYHVINYYDMYCEEKCKSVSFYYGLSGLMLDKKTTGYKIQMYNNDKLLQEDSIDNVMNIKYTSLELNESTSNRIKLKIIDENDKEVDNVYFMILNEKFEFKNNKTK